ncbi:MAG: hypothetical protein WC960_06555 [Bacteroidales bacterium]
MANNFFNINRFLLVAKRSVINYSRKERYLAIVVAALPPLFLLVNLLLNYQLIGLEFRTKLLLNIVTILFLFSPYLFFYEINHPSRGLIGVMVPASTFEKFIFMELTTLLFAPLTALSLYGGVDAILSIVAAPLFKGEAIRGVLQFISDIPFGTLISLLIVQQLVVLSNLLFLSKKFFKLIGSLLAFHFGVGVVALLISLLIPKESWSNLVESLIYAVSKGKALFTIVIKIVLSSTAVGLAALSYFRMRKLKF